MIKGHGIDIEELAAIERAYLKNARFATKVLTAAERSRFEELSGKRKIEFLAGRWAAKEAFSKLGEPVLASSDFRTWRF